MRFQYGKQDMPTFLMWHWKMSIASRWFTELNHVRLTDTVIVFLLQVRFRFCYIIKLPEKRYGRVALRVRYFIHALKVKSASIETICSVILHQTLNPNRLNNLYIMSSNLIGFL